MALMSIAEVKTAAYTRTIDSNQFKESDIEMAEFQYIKPVLTENFYNAVVLAPTTTYATLVTTYIKPALAYWVKYITFESFFTEISDRGINHLTGDNYQTASNQARTDLKTEILAKANILTEKLKDYINQQYYNGNADYSLYGNQSNTVTEEKFIGGILCDNNPIKTKEDYEQFRKYL